MEFLIGIAKDCMCWALSHTCGMHLVLLWSFSYGRSRYVTSFSTKYQTLSDCGISSSLVQVRVSGPHSEVQHTRTTVSWTWRTLVKVMMPYSAWLTQLLVADFLIVVFPEGTGTSPMKLGFLAVVPSGSSTGQEVRVQYFFTGGEVEWMESTVVRYLMQWISLRPYTLECTQQALVSAKDWVVPVSFIELYIYCMDGIQLYI